MKKILAISAVMLGIAMSSCSTLKNNDDQAFKERMQLDAYAKANIECELSLTKLQLNQNPDDRKLKTKYRNLNSEVSSFRRKIFRRYTDEGNMRAEFTNLVTESAPKLTVCKKLEELKQSIEEEKAKQLEQKK